MGGAPHVSVFPPCSLVDGCSGPAARRTRLANPPQRIASSPGSAIPSQPTPYRPSRLQSTTTWEASPISRHSVAPPSWRLCGGASCPPSGRGDAAATLAPQALVRGALKGAQCSPVSEEAFRDDRNTCRLRVWPCSDRDARKRLDSQGAAESRGLPAAPQTLPPLAGLVVAALSSVGSGGSAPPNRRSPTATRYRHFVAHGQNTAEIRVAGAIRGYLSQVRTGLRAVHAAVLGIVPALLDCHCEYRFSRKWRNWGALSQRRTEVARCRKGVTYYAAKRDYWAGQSTGGAP